MRSIILRCGYYTTFRDASLTRFIGTGTNTLQLGPGGPWAGRHGADGNARVKQGHRQKHGHLSTKSLVASTAARLGRSAANIGRSRSRPLAGSPHPGRILRCHAHCLRGRRPAPLGLTDAAPPPHTGDSLNASRLP